MKRLIILVLLFYCSSHFFAQSWKNGKGESLYGKIKYASVEGKLVKGQLSDSNLYTPVITINKYVGDTPNFYLNNIGDISTKLLNRNSIADYLEISEETLPVYYLYITFKFDGDPYYYKTFETFGTERIETNDTDIVLFVNGYDWPMVYDELDGPQKKYRGENILDLMKVHKTFWIRIENKQIHSDDLILVFEFPLEGFTKAINYVLDNSY